MDAANGTVTLAAAPLTGADVTAGFEFDVPVRFDTDELMAMVRGPRLFDLERIPLVEIRV
jgi:uncharacterized protein (TIGR02217 family)